MRTTPLKHLALGNAAALPASTPPDHEFLYCDVSSVDSSNVQIPDAPTTFAQAPSRARRVVNPGDTVISTVRPYLKAVAAVPETPLPLVFSTGFTSLTPQSDIDPRFLYWAVQSDEFIGAITRLADGVSYPAVRYEDLMSTPIASPPLEAQERIVRFLDIETAKIDKLIAKQQELLSMLDHRDVGAREALFASAVGDGKRLKHYLSEKDIRLGAAPLESNPLLSVSIHWGVQPRQEAVGSQSTADRFEHYKMVAPGDIVLNRMRAFQGAVGCSLVRGITSPDYAVLVSSPDVRPEWLVQVIKTQRFLDEIVVRLKGIGGTESGKVRTPRINIEDLLEIAVDVPEMSQQLVAMEELNAQSEKTARLRRLANTHIQLLSERRSALITAAVTGQIEV